MIKQNVQGDVWHSETLGYSVTRTSKGFVSLNSKSKFNTIKASNIFLRATDWKKVNTDT